MASRWPDITGQRFGMLTVVALVERTGRGPRLWLCRCDCGRERRVRTDCLTRGQTTSCGCAWGPNISIHRRVHGLTDTPEHIAWCGMRQRCKNPNDASFADYGGRGITVCERWQSFELFLADMGPRPSPDHSIDRKDVNGHYEPGNCRWATAVEQNNNKRTSIRLVFEGEALTVREWERRRGLPLRCIWMRLRAGWSVERAITTPADPVKTRARRARHGDAHDQAE